MWEARLTPATRGPLSRARPQAAARAWTTHVTSGSATQARALTPGSHRRLAPPAHAAHAGGVVSHAAKTPRRAAGHFNFSGTEVFATRYDRGGDGAFYPMAWDMANHGVVGEDRSALYEAACNKC
eukprot:270357-Prymnesium_polylepis.2